MFLIREALRIQGIEELTVFEDGEAGYDFIVQVDRGSAATPDLFILDLSLPRRTGPELLERIKSSRECSGVRIIIASSSRSPKDQSLAGRFGADRYFVKPSSFDAFMQIGSMAAELLKHAH